MAERQEPSDELLRQLALASAEQQLAAPGSLPWAELERLARGELGTEELAALELQARDRPELQAALDAHRPLPAQTRADIVSALLTGAVKPAAPLARAKPEAPHHQPPRRRWRWALLAAPGLALAAALVLFLSSRPLAELVPYELELRGARSTQRSLETASNEPVELPAHGSATLVLRPQRVHSAAVEAAVFVHAAGEVKRLAVRSEGAASGALRLTLDSGQLPARGELIVLVGYAGALPESPLSEALDAERRWQRFELAFALRAP